MPRFSSPISSYAEAWEDVHGKGGLAKKAQQWFSEVFPEGHATSIRPLVRRARELIGPDVVQQPLPGRECGFHVRALELIERYGIDYTPDMSKTEEFRAWETQPEIGSCFANSWSLMVAVNKSKRADLPEMVYVEGMVWGFMTDPVLHAWNSYRLTDVRALDWSHYVGCEWSRYIGIPFTQAEHEELRAAIFPKEPNRPVSLFDIEFFPLFEERIREMLASRETPTP